jgi:hypothetical protein
VTSGKYPLDSEQPPLDADLVQACHTATLLNQLSLKTVRVLVGGTMTVDVNNVPPQITSVDIDPATTCSMVCPRW